jgi:hypothetical protein
MTEGFTEPIRQRKKGNGQFEAYFAVHASAATPTLFPAISQSTDIHDDDPKIAIARLEASHIRPFTEGSFINIAPASKKILNDAFEFITNANDTILGDAERSNCFDEWKDLLKIITRKGDHFSSNHRKILGFLLTATNQKDISDFEIQILKIFQEATNILRQPRITKPETRRMIQILLENKIKATIPLVPDHLDEERIKSLDTIMDHLLEKADLNNE